MTSRHAKVFVLDMFHETGLTGSLQAVLESSAGSTIRLQREVWSFNEFQRGNGQFLDRISGFDPDVIFLVLDRLEGKQLRELMAIIFGALRQPAIVVSAGADPDQIIEILRLGATDFIVPPLKPNDVLPRLWRVLDQQRNKTPLALVLKKRLGLEQLVGESPAFLTEIQKIPLVARCDASVLITGETGTGKELCARAVHYLSPRSGQPFIPVSCGAIPSELVENELFGHVRGAFTGAHAPHPGLIREADGGTLFLDDIDCLPLQAQVKLLRFLQEREYKQLGSTKTNRADLRIVAATNINLENGVRDGRFRQDLFYRLNVIPVNLPALKDRKEDIPLLAYHFLAKYSRDFAKECRDFSPGAMAVLLAHGWSGNVRELENVVARAVVFSEGTTIRRGDIMLHSPPAVDSWAPYESFRTAKARVVEQFEREYIEGLLKTHRGNITRAAQAAEKNRRAFWELIRKHRIDMDAIKAGRP
ncbi:MAG TPA: sigma-54-dependent Fis family transcriptional regulator [Syntrophorhabdus aromaticivorans]|nr:sigma-54-dependent Fis family transcriptional regulator [Syntrophorhabdus aromaticivorans]